MYAIRSYYAVDVVRTETFTVLAMCQWFNVLNCESATRSALRGDVLRNRWLLGGLLLSLALQVLVIYAPPMNALFHTVPLPPAIPTAGWSPWSFSTATPVSASCAIPSRSWIRRRCVCWI